MPATPHSSRALLAIFAALLALGAPAKAASNALDAPALGPYKADDFRLTSGDCRDCNVPRQALWYFRGETIAVAKPGLPASGFSRNASLAGEAQAALATGELRYPGLVWLGAPHLLAQTSITADNRLRLVNGDLLDWQLSGRLSSNRSWYDASSATFFRQRWLKLRGTQQPNRPFVARSIWPRDFSLPARPQLQPLGNRETIQQLVQAEHGGAHSPFAVRWLWSRAQPRLADWSGKAILGVMLNGAQGDDDEAHGGHFAVVTGRVQPDGDISDWLVNNFYSLDNYSEKGITAATLPLDSYLADLNSGQQWYRPSYMLFAVLRDERVAIQAQDALNRVMNHFYRHDLVYSHSQLNCTGLSMDTLRALGWHIPNAGTSGMLAAGGGLLLSTLTNLSVDKGLDTYHYMQAELTRLLPAVAFREAGADLLNLAQQPGIRALSPYEQSLSGNIEAIAFVRFPQFPSSRKWGQAPVFSNGEYASRTPFSRSDWQIVPVAKRPFPDTLRD